jgi:BirA family transcriptional regulator, biotin operon repressor / biotin---[acetyl-CoA-carboxylase] ligase
VERPELDVTALRTALAPRWPRVEVVDTTDSTNADLLADPSAPDRSVLVAEHQLAGRGRFDRTWTSPPRAGLTFSALLRPSVPMADWGWLPLLAGMALREAVADVLGLDTGLKWPNDLLAADGRKLAGILAQTAGPVVVVGIGLNVSTSEAELPVETATSLLLAGAEVVDRSALLVAILRRLDARYAQWSDCEGDAAACGLAEAYRSACTTLGRDVHVRLAADDVVEGTAVDVDDRGRLLVRTQSGDQPVGAGDVEHVRPA